MFFENFPVTFHKTINGEEILVSDIVRAINIPSDVLNDHNLYEYYLANDNETPEIISHKFYKSTAYHWVIMAINQRYDMWNDYPKDDNTIRTLCENKYNNGIDGIHHYEGPNGDVVDEFTVDKAPVSNYEYESEENEKKRMIKVLKSIYLSEFISLYTNLIKE